VLSDVCGEEQAADLYKQALGYDPNLVSAHVQLGFSYAYAEEYQAMIAALNEAIRLDPEAARTAACGVPEETFLISRILFPPEPTPAARTYGSVMPAEFQEAGELIVAAKKYLIEGQTEEAIQNLELSLTIDETNPLAIALLALTYLLSKGNNDEPSREKRVSVLFKIDVTLGV
jgi:tetratricopeptide (TPR) repeat protein